MDSTELIRSAKDKFKELEHKGYEWRSFYNGYLAAHATAMIEFKNCNLPVVSKNDEGVVVCPHCEGTGKDGHDREDPPNWYICDECNGSGETDC